MPLDMGTSSAGGLPLGGIFGVFVFKPPAPPGGYKYPLSQMPEGPPGKPGLPPLNPGTEGFPPSSTPGIPTPPQGTPPGGGPPVILGPDGPLTLGPDGVYRPGSPPVYDPGNGTTIPLPNGGKLEVPHGNRPPIYTPPPPPPGNPGGSAGTFLRGALNVIRGGITIGPIFPFDPGIFYLDRNDFSVHPDA
jgi:hypothetical protein